MTATFLAEEANLEVNVLKDHVIFSFVGIAHREILVALDLEVKEWTEGKKMKHEMKVRGPKM